MGTYTDFTGAIRITPCLKEPLAGRFRQFLGIRHMKRDVKILEALFPTLEERKAVTLFGDGDFGEDGAFGSHAPHLFARTLCGRAHR